MLPRGQGKREEGVVAVGAEVRLPAAVEVDAKGYTHTSSAQPYPEAVCPLEAFELRGGTQSGHIGVSRCFA